MNTKVITSLLSQTTIPTLLAYAVNNSYVHRWTMGHAAKVIPTGGTLFTGALATTNALFDQAINRSEYFRTNKIAKGAAYVLTTCSSTLAFTLAAPRLGMGVITVEKAIKLALLVILSQTATRYLLNTSPKKEEKEQPVKKETTEETSVANEHTIPEPYSLDRASSMSYSFTQFSTVSTKAAPMTISFTVCEEATLEDAYRSVSPAKEVKDVPLPPVPPTPPAVPTEVTIAPELPQPDAGKVDLLAEIRKGKTLKKTVIKERPKFEDADLSKANLKGAKFAKDPMAELAAAVKKKAK